MGWRDSLGDGQFWVKFWLVSLVIVTIWGTVTMIWSLYNTINIVLLSIFALILGCGGGFQSSLGMRKADPKDPL